MRALGMAVIAAALLAACGENAGGTPTGTATAIATAPLPLTGGVARFVIEPPKEGYPWLPEVAVHVVFEGPEPSFGLAWPDDSSRLRVLGAGEVEAEGGRVFEEVWRPGTRLLELPPRDVPTLSFPRMELVPRDVDGDGVADRLDGEFAVYPELCTGDVCFGGPVFTTHAEAAIVPASLGSPRYLPPWNLGDAALPSEPILVRFDLPSRVESARIVTASRELPVSWSDWPTRRVEFTPGELLPWAETIRIEGEARVLGAGAALEPFSLELQAATPPAAPWTESFEAEDQDGLVVTHGNVILADDGQGLPAIDGERFLLVGPGAFGFFFEVDVPDTENPLLRLDARFAYHADGVGSTPSGELIAAGAGFRSTAYLGHRFFRSETALDGGEFTSVSPTETVEVSLASLRGNRAIIAIRGFPPAASELPVADGSIQLDGLRIVP